MRSSRHLLSIEDAARFAMAPSEDDMDDISGASPDEALRNGHVEAARKIEAQHPVAVDSRGVWELFSGWLGGRAHA